MYFAGQGRLTSGLNSIRPTLTKFDLNGNMLWSKLHLRSPSQSARLYNMDLFIENDTIINCGRGTLSGDNLVNSEMLFYKTDINGNLIMAKSYAVLGGTFTAGYRVSPIPDGYIVQGTYNEANVQNRFFVARLNKNGDVVWAKKINNATVGDGITKHLTLVDAGFIVFAAETDQYDSGQNNDLIFGKIMLDGQMSNDSCDIVEDITLVAVNVANPFDGIEPPAILFVNNRVVLK